jgi:hypothetical protein
MRFVSLVAFLSAASVLPALADNAPAPSVAPSAQRVRGKIEAYDPATRVLNITGSDKKPLLVSLEPDVRVIYDARLKLTDLKAGDFIGSTTLKTADGKLHAQEVHVFPDAMRGAGEGQYPASDANPNRLMTNATVAEVAAVAANKGTITAHLSRRRSGHRRLLHWTRRRWCRLHRQRANPRCARGTHHRVDGRR